MTYRVGRHLGRTIYRVVSESAGERDELIGIMDTADLGMIVVDALNAAERMRERAAKIWAPVASVPPFCQRTGMHNCSATGRWENHDVPAQGTSDQSPGKDQLSEVSPLHPRRDMALPQSCQDENGEACPQDRCKVEGPHYLTRDESTHP